MKHISLSSVLLSRPLTSLFAAKQTKVNSPLTRTRQPSGKRTNGMDSHAPYCTWIVTLTLPNQNERNFPVGLLNCWVFKRRYFQLSWARTRIRAPAARWRQMQINTNEESFAWLIHESTNGILIPISEITFKDITRQAIKVLLLLPIPTKLSVTTSQFWEKNKRYKIVLCNASNLCCKIWPVTHPGVYRLSRTNHYQWERERPAHLHHANRTGSCLS